MKEGRIKLNSIPVMREYLDVFPKVLPGLFLVREIEVSIKILPGTTHIAHSPYRMAPAKLVKLKVQLQELLDKGFIRPSNSL